jgi:hypothetical protein
MTTLPVDVPHTQNIAPLEKQILSSSTWESISIANRFLKP